MYKCLQSIVLSVFLITGSIHSVAAEDSRLDIRTDEYTFSQLMSENLISQDGYADLVALGVQPNDQVLVRVSRDLDTVNKRIQSGDNLQTLSSPAYPEHGDEKEHRWQREEGGNLYQYKRVETYFEQEGSGGEWIETDYRRTYVGPAPGNGDAPPTNPE